MANSTDIKPAIDKRYARFRLGVATSRIHRWGVYALESIPAGRKVIEYTGVKIDRAEYNRREETTYVFELNQDWLVDGGVAGSGAELINHSCEPNLVTRILKGHILYFSLRPIKKGEELTIDYNYDDTDELMICGCGSKACRGTINVTD
jgi:SET domain-containing protein